MHPAHPRELHELAAASSTTVILGPTGRAVGQHPTILPGSLEERRILQELDAERRRDEPAR
jgi:hypothetical protein